MAERSDRPDRALSQRPVLALIALILLVGLGAGALLGFLQWRTQQGLLNAARGQEKALTDQLAALREGNAISREGAVAGARAYVVFRGLSLSGSVSADDPGNSRFQVNPVWENVGNTPTRNMEIYTNPIKPILHPILDMTMPKTPDVSAGLLAPHATGMGGSSTLSGADLLAIRQGRLRLYIWGWARYHDVFPATAERLTRFCLIVNGVQGDPNVPGEASLAGPPCGPYGDNFECTDSECGPQR